MASEYSRDLSRKVNAGHRQRQKAGLVITNNSMWGYRQAKGSKRLTIDEVEAEYIRKVFNWYVEGKGFRSIFKLLEEEKIRNRNGKPFAMTTLKRIIKNEKYKGTLVVNKTHKDFDTKQIYNNPESEWITHENIIPPIISEEIWNKANQILKTKKRKNNVDDKEIIAGYFTGRHLYSSKIVCGECGRTFWHTIYRQKELWMCKEYKSFGLKTENKVHGCWNEKIYTVELNMIVKQAIYDTIQNKEMAIRDVTDAINLSFVDNSDYKDANKVNNEIEKLQNRKNKIIDMMADGLIVKDEYIISKKLVDEKIWKLETKIKYINKIKTDIKTKTQRLKEIEQNLKIKLDAPECITDEIIENLLDKIIIKPKRKLDIYILGQKHEVDRNNQHATTTRCN